MLVVKVRNKTTGQVGLIMETLSPVMVLAVDDNSDDLVSLKRLFKPFPNVVLETVTDPYSLADRVLEAHYDWVLLDVNLPEMSGLKIASLLLQTNPELKNKIVFMTGESPDSRLLRFAEKQGANWLPKPLNQDDVTGLIERRVMPSLRHG